MPFDEIKQAGLDELLYEYKLRKDLIRAPIDLAKFDFAEIESEIVRRIETIVSVHGGDDNLPAIPLPMAGGKVPPKLLKKIPSSLLAGLQIPPASTAAQVQAVGDNQMGVAMLVPKQYRHSTNDGYCHFDTAYFGDGLCAFSKFSEEYCIPDAFSGFLVSERRIATARHAVNQYAETDLCVIFGVARIPKGGPFRIPVDQVYDVAARVKVVNDCICLELDRPVVGRTPTPVRSAKIEDGCPVYMIGHPRGLALKIAGNAKVVDNAPAESFTASVDAYGGHSGSPIYRAGSHEIVGMLLGSNTDLQLTSAGCKIIKSTIDPLDPGESCARASIISALIA